VAPEELQVVVEAFLDGEVVDPSALRTALADSAARDHFIELLMIRRATRATDYLAMCAPAASAGRPRVARWLAAVAAAALVSVSLGYAAGQRVVVATSVEAAVMVDAVPAAPPATRTITLQPGVNWTDGPGEQ
jgi:hypothetical protein